MYIISKELTDIVPGSTCSFGGWVFCYTGNTSAYSEPIATITITNGKIVSCDDDSSYDNGSKYGYSVEPASETSAYIYRHKLNNANVAQYYFTINILVDEAAASLTINVSPDMVTHLKTSVTYTAYED